MLRNTFLHIPRIGPKTEAAIWESGLTTWEDLLQSPGPHPLRDRFETHLVESAARFEARDAAYFDRRLPMRDKWRMFADFLDTAAFLDIETTGLSPDSSRLTMVGILDTVGFHAFVRDENLDELPDALESYDLVVTYNGASFDLPYLRHSLGTRKYDRLFERKAHLDLRSCLRRLGLTGGLKAIERRTGLARPSLLSGLSGYDAVLMWRAWEEGNSGARDTLVRYNAEDVASLPLLAELAYNRLAGRLPLEVPPLRPIDWPSVDHLEFDIDVVAALSERRMSPTVWW